MDKTGLILAGVPHGATRVISLTDPTLAKQRSSDVLIPQKMLMLFDEYGIPSELLQPFEGLAAQLTSQMSEISLLVSSWDKKKPVLDQQKQLKNMWISLFESVHVALQLSGKRAPDNGPIHGKASKILSHINAAMMALWITHYSQAGNQRNRVKFLTEEINFIRHKGIIEASIREALRRLYGRDLVTSTNSSNNHYVLVELPASSVILELVPSRGKLTPIFIGMQQLTTTLSSSFEYIFNKKPKKPMVFRHVLYDLDSIGELVHESTGLPTKELIDLLSANVSP